METLAEKYAGMKNILVVGHGGSITSFYGFYGALSSRATKRAYFLSTTDPDYIASLKNILDPKDTLVVSISKSGENTTQIEALLQFTNYPMLFVTGPGSPVAEIGKTLGAEVVNHPSIGGRYTGFTEVGLLPALLCGLDAKKLWAGGQDVLKHYAQANEAWDAASVLWHLEQSGYVDVFMPFYSHELFNFGNVIVQLCHESFGKEGRGQTYTASEAPESQHHTNQRFFGGPKNIAGFFISQDHYDHDLATKVPDSLKDISIKQHRLEALDAIPLEHSMKSEREGTMEDARANKIPMAHLSIERCDENELGKFLAFWQLYAVYASLLRSVDPFDQPQVEEAKRVSFEKRKSEGARRGVRMLSGRTFPDRARDFHSKGQETPGLADRRRAQNAGPDEGRNLHRARRRRIDDDKMIFRAGSPKLTSD